MIFSLGIGDSGATSLSPIPTPVSTPQHRERRNVKTSGASAVRNSAVGFDRRKPPDGGGEQLGIAKTCVPIFPMRPSLARAPPCTLGPFPLFGPCWKSISSARGGWVA